MRMNSLVCLTSAFLLCLPEATRAECVGTDILAEAPVALIAALEAEADAQPYARGRIWEVEKHGRRSVLFGTFHAPDPEIGQVPGIVDERLQTARLAVVEITSAEQERLNRALLLNPELIFNADGPDLPAYFSEEDWTFLADRAQAAGIETEVARHFQPWVLSSVLSLPACVEEARASGAEVLDREIERLAAEALVPVQGLEGLDQLIRSFPRGSFEQQLAGLRRSLPMMRDGEAALVTARALYLRGEIWQIWALGGVVASRYFDDGKVKATLAAMHERMIVRRNRAWMDRLLPELRRGNAVVAVGAMHLPGEDGLLRMLERDGFTVRRLDL